MAQDANKSPYRETLNLPVTDFPMKADLPRREPERLLWWEENGLYARLRRERAGRPVRMLHDGPPYSNAHIHMGTAANKIWKDAVVRVANLLGFDAPYVPGWDNHGMPIEIHVTREFRERKEQPDRKALRRRCRDYAAEWVAVQRDEFRRLGVWGEWEHPYLTMDHAFEAEILEAFARLAGKGFVQRGQRSIHWCPTDRTALAEAEIEYHDLESPSIFVAFPLRSDVSGVLKGLDRCAAVAWTTTPWTLPANLGLMVDPAADYVAMRVGDSHYLVADARRAAVSDALGWTDATVARRLEGRDLVGSRFVGPWDKDSRVVDGTPFVTLEDGTGLVHTAPGHGKEDFQVGQRSGLGVLCPVDEAGRYTEGAEPFVGRSVLEVDPDVIRMLERKGRLLGERRILHSYPHCWRCKRPVIFRATDQWFMIIDHAGHRGRCLELIEGAVRWDPGSSLNRIRESVRNRPDWCLSRQRSWGVGIPALYCDACGRALLDPEVMKRAAQRTRELGSDDWFQAPVETVLPDGFRCEGCGAAGPFRKETDILDVWFDSGSTHFAVRRTHPALDQAWARAEEDGGRVLYFEGPDQHRGWFNSSLMVSAGMRERAPFSDVLTHGWVLDDEGKAMHKSLGNVIHPQDLIARFGADIVRWWALATDWRNDVRVGPEIMTRVSEAYRKVRNTFRFLLGNLSDFDPEQALPSGRMTGVDRAFGSYLSVAVELIRRDYDEHLFHRAIDRILDLCTVGLSAVFLDAAKDRLYTLAPDDPRRRSAQTALWHALHDLAIAVSPVLAFTAEEIWQSHRALRAERPSVHLALWPAAADPARDASEWELLVRLRDAVNAALEPARASRALATTSEAEVTITARRDIVDRLARYAGELEGFLLVAKAVIVPVDAGAPDREFLVAPPVKTGLRKCERCWTHRDDVGSDPSSPSLCARCVAALAARRAPLR